MYLIVGLGNPGERYEDTRHNLGFKVVDEYRRKKELGEWQLEKKFKAEIIKTESLILARPQTFMNLSGMAVSRIAEFYKIDTKDIVVVHDELDLPLGHMKIRLGGAAAGHHGVESIIKVIGDRFIRLRLGIGNLESLSGEHKHRAFNAEHFVTDFFLPAEKSKVKAMVKRGVKALEIILNKGFDKAQNQFN